MRVLITTDSQRLLQHQRYSFDDTPRDIAALPGLCKCVLPLICPFVRRNMLKLSPYWRAAHYGKFLFGLRHPRSWEASPEAESRRLSRGRKSSSGDDSYARAVTGYRKSNRNPL